MRNRNNLLPLFFCLIFFSSAKTGIVSAQLNSDSAFKVEGYIEAFYTYDFDADGETDRLPWLFNHNRHNQISINLAMVNFRYKKDGMRANFGIQGGTYPMDNYSHEPSIYRHIAEANIGVSLTKNRRLWLDAGIMPSHLGFASLISQENFTLTRSLSAENSPYYSAGAKLTYTSKNERWLFSGLALNGWQQIRNVANHKGPSFGSQIQYIRDKVLLNWSTFYGPQSMTNGERRDRYFSNLYAKWEPTKHFGLIAGFDAGVQQSAALANREWDDWYSATLIAQYSVKKVKLGLRGEYFLDDYKVVASPFAVGGGSSIMGASLNVDYAIRKNALVRIEARQLSWIESDKALFAPASLRTDASFSIATSLAVSF